MFEPIERTIDYQSMAKRFAALTTPLPLAGSKPLREVGDELVITRQLRALAPCCAPAIDLLDKQWRVQLWVGWPWITLRPLMSRLDIVEIDGPRSADLNTLLAQVLVDLGRRWQLAPGQMPAIHPQGEQSLRMRFVRHRSARQLLREGVAAIASVAPLLERPTQ